MVLAFAGLVLWAVGAAVMGIVKAVRARGGSPNLQIRGQMLGANKLSPNLRVAD